MSNQQRQSQDQIEQNDAEKLKALTILESSLTGCKFQHKNRTIHGLIIRHSDVPGFFVVRIADGSTFNVHRNDLTLISPKDEPNPRRARSGANP